MSPDLQQSRLFRSSAAYLAALVLLACLLLPCGLPQALSRARQQQPLPPPPGEISFRLLGAFEPAGGVAQDAAWLDEEQLLVLSLGPQGAEVLKASSGLKGQSVFIPHDYLAAQVCPAAFHDRLQMQLSPARRFLLFQYFDDNSNRHAVLLDISKAPEFSIFEPGLPEGMQINNLQFSPDDRYLVLAHDGYRPGSEVSLLALDLAEGKELWRLGPHQLNFIHALWWNSDPQASGFAVSAEVHNGEFQAGPGVARFDLASHQWSFKPETGNLLLYSEAGWGAAAAYQSRPGSKAPYHLKFSPRGGEPGGQKGQLLLNSEPLWLGLLPDSGYALLLNRSDTSAGQLWQFNLSTAKRYLVDGDCRVCELGPQDRLLVVGGASNAVRSYQLRRPAPPKAAALAP